MYYVRLRTVCHSFSSYFCRLWIHGTKFWMWRKWEECHRRIKSSQNKGNTNNLRNNKRMMISLWNCRLKRLNWCRLCGGVPYTVNAFFPFMYLTFSGIKYYKIAIFDGATISGLCDFVMKKKLNFPAVGGCEYYSPAPHLVQQQQQQPQ